MKKKIIFSFVFIWLSLSLWAARQPEFSTAGFFRLDNSGREVFSMNPAWRFYKGAADGAERAVASIIRGKSGIGSILCLILL